MKIFCKIFCVLLVLNFGYDLTAQGISTSKSRYKVAVIDLMILKRQKLGAFQLTKGCDERE